MYTPPLLAADAVVFVLSRVCEDVVANDGLRKVWVAPFTRLRDLKCEENCQQKALYLHHPSLSSHGSTGIHLAYHSPEPAFSLLFPEFSPLVFAAAEAKVDTNGEGIFCEMGEGKGPIVERVRYKQLC